ncbi:precorrin-2 dehydrogenase/sirohydrochlorin ferrochelatase family protein [Singulisphaera sp. PoT]|uniref:precorrin-2 dehydrogenase/sirohydrochlorin ferrochelatase family protein n=1 Tax=Singulisphaera sp. PoT TaxID=3411797 RepID=UPI003BF54845
MSGYPIELDLRGKTVLVVGLGNVGRRKAEGLIGTGARVIVVDPDPAGRDPVEGAEILAEPYSAEHLRGVSLVLAAGPAPVNRQVVADARAAGIWVNTASDPDLGDFRIPAIWREGLVTVTASTSGASPALAAKLRDKAASAIGPEVVELAAFLSEIRPQVLERVGDPAVRRRLLADLAEPYWLELWTTVGAEAVLSRFREKLEEAAGSPN